MLKKVPDVQEWSMNLEKVSLMGNQWLHIPLEMSPPKCPRLTTLLLSQCNIVSIPEGFFKHMDALKILDLSWNPIKSLPHSLSNLKNLTSLLLDCCEDLGNVPSLSNLGVLRKLDLRGTNIKEIPHGMENLVSLEHLNLDQSKNLNEIPNGVLSRLCCLQDLIVGETLINGKEVGGLKKLQGTLGGRFYDLHNLNMYLEACRGREQPRQFRIFVGDMDFPKFSEVVRKAIVASGRNIYNYQIVLPHDIEGLRIWFCNVDCSEEYPLFSRVGGCKQLEEIITSEVEPEERGMVITEFHLPQLGLLSLGDLPELKSICSAGGVLVCDSLLQIEIVDCPRLKRMGLNLPKFDNVPPSASANLSLSVRIRPKEWWESLEWDGPQPKSLLDPFVIVLPGDIDGLDIGYCNVDNTIDI
ncbi:probable disease resistance protein At4g27220 [Hibiscus syriacus]|uniref:probable disease resistance protein At4g27220 n=1 Tax=Hibiscus syriacus TaxID=106335 RepID=UPI0019232878|nr:probable disease resistance protein At4g27220 [Hibiscus syriacus]